jgi:hypothetical protein
MFCTSWGHCTGRHWEAAIDAHADHLLQLALEADVLARLGGDDPFTSVRWQYPGSGGVTRADIFNSITFKSHDQHCDVTSLAAHLGTKPGTLRRTPFKLPNVSSLGRYGSVLPGRGIPRRVGSILGFHGPQGPLLIAHCHRMQPGARYVELESNLLAAELA